MRFSLVPQAHAQTPGPQVGCEPGSANVNLNDCYTLNESQSVGDVYQRPTDIVNIIVRNGFIVAGLIIFFLILYAGYKLIEQGQKGLEEAKSIGETALIGFIVMFAAYWAVRILEIVLGIDIIF